MSDESDYFRGYARDVGLNPAIGAATNVQDALGGAFPSGGLATAPPSSNTATATFAGFAVDTPKQNTLAYDVLVSGTIRVTSATAGTLALGVGPTATPTTNALLASYTNASASVIPFSAVVPAGYYLSIVSGGTIVVASATAVASPL